MKASSSPRTSSTPARKPPSRFSPGLNWIAKEKGAKSFFFIGSDYIWPRTSNKIARKHVENVLKGKVVGEEYYALGSTQFNSVINKIKLTKPDVIFTDVVGGSNVAFYKQLKAAGVDLSKQALLTISVTEDEIDGIGGENIAGAYACMKYFQSLDNANNKAFVPAFKKLWGEKTVIGDVTQAAYLGPWLWKLTVREGRQLRRRQDRSRLDRHRIQGGARRLRAHPRKPSPLVEDPRRQGQARWPVRADLRDRRSGRARSVPEGLPVSLRSLRSFPEQQLPGVDRQSALDDPASRLCSRRGTLSLDGETSMFGEYSIGDLGSIFVMQGFAGLILFSVYVLMALGLAIIFGQMGVINMAHGEFMILGAYVTWLTSNTFQSYLPSLFSGYFFLAMALAFLASGALGMLVEWALIRHLYKRPLDTLLATWGLSLILQQTYRSVFGAARSRRRPAAMDAGLAQGH